ncbi:hypothetical protein KQH42_07165 [Streptomyces sp. CHA1]|nr:hypothetical protein [Streptomyces sp. G11C]MCO6700294.1 hypothetical protein [Streptomyces sp. CHB9.2]MCO6706429.1 hypothetical protein [Streptomyces sp. CHA3]MCO6712172.1 hypothetical protein [Streptomyces sp. CHB19.2]MCO6718606.1 hypothetical protein [Streptomyces sp. Vc714c-19]MCO6724209.1 hypothetical protein [Streptomyces sp. CHA16]MCO6730144.1 hypothetical protein [Streptomyces sp. EL9]MCO6735813.1 hypothetical protein [Streptomyces sp. CHA15]MCO6742090.1 hypothetical protein [Str
MVTTQSSPRPRAAAALEGARAARRRLTFIGVMARQLDQIAPGTARVRIVPVHTDRNGEQHVALWVSLDDALGLPLRADRNAHRAALSLLRRAFPAADWTRPRAYDTATGDLVLDAPGMPEELRR